MLMFNFHMAFSLGLIALAFGAAILIWSKAHEGSSASFARLIGYIILIVSVPNLLCNSYWAVKYWAEGNYDKPYPMMMQHPMMQGQMMGGKNTPMMPCPMMSGQMMKGQDEQNQMMPMNDQMGIKQMPGPMMQNQMNNAPMTQGAAAEVQKPLSNNPAEHAEHHQ